MAKMHKKILKRCSLKNSRQNGVDIFSKQFKNATNNNVQKSVALDINGWR